MSEFTPEAVVRLVGECTHPGSDGVCEDCVAALVARVDEADRKALEAQDCLRLAVDDGENGRHYWKARADRYEAEFSACKALLIAEQKRAERAEAERAEAQRDLRDFKRDCDRMLEDAYQGGRRAEARAEEAERMAREAQLSQTRVAYDLAAAEQRASEARAALERVQGCVVRAAHALALALKGDGIDGADLTETTTGVSAGLVEVDAHITRALAALPVEPARRQVTENANALGAPAALSPATPEGDT